MPDFLKAEVGNESFIRGAARLMWAGATVTFPTRIGDIVNLSSYDAMTGWFDLGATKTGIQISINNTEESFDVDQIYSDLDTQPTSWEASVGTQLAEMTLERLAIAWEGSTPVTETSMSPNEKVVNIGAPRVYIKRRLAVLFQKDNEKVRAFIFRKITRMAVESAVTFNKTGEQISIPVRFRALPDLSVADLLSRLFVIRDQI